MIGATSKSVRLLFSVGGAKAPSRVDIADLFANRLAAKGFDITWHFLSPETGPALSRQTWHGQPAYVIGRSRLPGALGRAASKLMELWADLVFVALALRGNFDIIQVRDKFFVALLGLVAARLKAVPFVYWLSYPFPEARLIDAQEGRSRYPWFSWLTGTLSSWILYRVILPKADLVFVQSEQMKRDVARPWIDSGKLVPVPMGIPDEELPDRNMGQPFDSPVVLHLGTLIRVRRLAMLIGAFARVLKDRPDARLVFVGDGDDPEDRASLEAEVKRLGLQESVVFTGQLPREQALEWVRRAMVCLSPFYPTFVLRSTSPTKLIEYMAMGKAVVANDHPEQADVIAQSGAGICTAWDEEAFAKAILELLNHPKQVSEMGQRGREWVARNRVYSRIADDVFHRYMALIKYE